MDPERIVKRMVLSDEERASSGPVDPWTGVQPWEPPHSPIRQWAERYWKEFGILTVPVWGKKAKLVVDRDGKTITLHKVFLARLFEKAPDARARRRLFVRRHPPTGLAAILGAPSGHLRRVAGEVPTAANSPYRGPSGKWVFIQNHTTSRALALYELRR